VSNSSKPALTSPLPFSAQAIVRAIGRAASPRSSVIAGHRAGRNAPSRASAAAITNACSLALQPVRSCAAQSAGASQIQHQRRKDATAIFPISIGSMRHVSRAGEICPAASLVITADSNRLACGQDRQTRLWALPCRASGCTARTAHTKRCHNGPPANSACHYFCLLIGQSRLLRAPVASNRHLASKLALLRRTQ